MHAPEWTEQRRRRLAVGIVHHADELREAEGPSNQDDLVVAIVALLAECRDQRRAALKLALGQLDLAYKCMEIPHQGDQDLAQPRTAGALHYAQRTRSKLLQRLDARHQAVSRQSTPPMSS